MAFCQSIDGFASILLIGTQPGTLLHPSLSSSFISVTKAGGGMQEKPMQLLYMEASRASPASSGHGSFWPGPGPMACQASPHHVPQVDQTGVGRRVNLLATRMTIQINDSVRMRSMLGTLAGSKLFATPGMACQGLQLPKQGDHVLRFGLQDALLLQGRHGSFGREWRTMMSESLGRCKMEGAKCSETF